MQTKRHHNLLSGCLCRDESGHDDSSYVARVGMPTCFEAMWCRYVSLLLVRLIQLFPRLFRCSSSHIFSTFIFMLGTVSEVLNVDGTPIDPDNRMLKQLPELLTQLEWMAVAMANQRKLSGTF